MLLSKQETIYNCFLQRCVTILLISTVYLKGIFIFRKHVSDKVRNTSNKIILFKQNLGDIILIFQHRAGIVINLDEWKQLSRKAWESEYDCLQVDGFS